MSIAAHPPRGAWRLLARLPIWLYRARLGWLLGHRFLLLTHIGRKSGRLRQVVLEVVRHDRANSTYYVASGFGDKADWYLNICQTPEVTVQVSWRSFKARAEPLSFTTTLAEFQDYGRRHPTALAALSRVLGYYWDGTETSYQRLARQVPMVALRPAR